MSFPLTQTGTRYRVYMTPRVSNLTYGSEIEVSDHITFNGINQIKRAIDSQDYDIGVYFYSDLQLMGSNDNGYFNENDSRSIFPYLRDRTKVRVVFENTAGDHIVFYGLINEEATKIDALNETAEFSVLSRDSVIRNTQVAGGTVASGVSVKTAVLNILSQASISSVLTVSSVNISPSVNFLIDNGSAFDNQPTQDALNQLLLASNSVMTLDSSGNVTVKSRSENTTTPILNLYGPYEVQRRQNVIDVKNYNTGLQRMFTSVSLTDGNGVETIVDNVALAQTYGYRQTQVSFDFITTPGIATTVATALLNQFSVPKIELEVEIPTSVANGLDLLDRVSLDWPLRITPPSGKFLPIIGTSVIGNTNTPIPSKSGSLVIDPAMAFKVLEIDDDPNSFTSIVKLRQVGSTLSDGWFSVPTSSIIGYAVVGTSIVGGTGSLANQWNPSVLGAAQVGSTKVA